jgi:hypothetical protein
LISRAFSDSLLKYDVLLFTLFFRIKASGFATGVIWQKPETETINIKNIEKILFIRTELNLNCELQWAKISDFY